MIKGITFGWNLQRILVFLNKYNELPKILSHGEYRSHYVLKIGRSSSHPLSVIHFKDLWFIWLIQTFVEIFFPFVLFSVKKGTVDKKSFSALGVFIGPGLIYKYVTVQDKRTDWIILRIKFNMCFHDQWTYLLKTRKTRTGTQVFWSWSQSSFSFILLPTCFSLA